ncbi:hypothetical protein ZWY2020_052394 [Hordeum vulgare]|nr:hypothetical protein ZWY2020_052394 [Hordeum vulgare]
MTATIVGTMDANVERSRVVVRSTDVALALVEAIHTKIDDAHAKIFQAPLESNMQPTSEKAAEAMEHVLPYEIAEDELEMQEAVDIEESVEEELHVAEDEVEKSPPIKESAVEYQHEL